MEYGLQIINDAGFVQIDSTYKNLYLAETGSSATDTVDGGVLTTSRKTLSFSGRTSPVLFLRGTSGVLVTCGAVTVSAGAWNFSVWAAAAVGVGFTYYLFDVPPLAPTGTGYGLEVYNASGEVTFSTNYKYQKVVDFQKGFDAASSGGTAFGDYTYTAGRVYAHSMASPGFKLRFTPEGPGGTPPPLSSTMAVGAYGITNGLHIDGWMHRRFSGGPSAGGGTWGAPADILIADVTGF